MAHIVQAKTEDAEAIGRFQTRCWEQTYRGIAPDEFLDATTAQIRADRWVERIAGGSRRVLMALSDDELLIGVASTARADRTADGLPVLELCTIYVDERAQGTGVAGRLLEAALGMRTLTCSCSRSTHERSTSTPSMGSAPVVTASRTSERVSTSSGGSAELVRQLHPGR